MAVASVTSASAVGADTTTLTTSGTIDLGTADYGMFFCGFTHNAAARTVSSMSFNGVALTEVADTANSGGTHPGIAIYKWPDSTAFPSSGTHDLVSVMSGNTDDRAHGGQSFTGAASTQSGTANSGTGTPASGTPQPSSGAVTGVANGIVFAACTTEALPAAISPTETQILEADSHTNQQTTVNVSNTTASGSVNPSWSGVPNGNGWAAAAFPISPAAGGGTAVPVFYMHRTQHAMA